MKKEYWIMIYLVLLFISFSYGAYEQTQKKLDSLTQQVKDLESKNAQLERSLSDYIDLYGKLKICPEAWTRNEMPCGGSGCGDREVFQINGQDRDSSEFDLNWISKNCKVSKPAVLY